MFIYFEVFEGWNFIKQNKTKNQFVFMKTLNLRNIPRLSEIVRNEATITANLYIQEV